MVALGANGMLFVVEPDATIPSDDDLVEIRPSDGTVLFSQSLGTQVRYPDLFAYNAGLVVETDENDVDFVSYAGKSFNRYR